MKPSATAEVAACFCFKMSLLGFDEYVLHLYTAGPKS